MKRHDRSHGAHRSARLAAGLALLWPAVGQACAVCGAAAERNRIALLIMTIVMSLLPLAMFAGGALWLRRNVRRANARERAAHPADGSAVAPRTPPAPAGGPLVHGGDAAR